MNLPETHIRSDSPVPSGTSPLRRWMPEAALVLVSAVLGFCAAQYGEYRQERQLGARILSSIEAEVTHNLAVLEPMVPFHEAWVRSLDNAGKTPAGSGIDVFFATRPPFPTGARSPFPTLRRSAWDAAVAGGSVRLLDYDVVSALSEIYRAQEIAIENVGRLASGALAETATYDPASRDASVRLLWLTLADIHAAELRLLELYREHLSTLR